MQSMMDAVSRAGGSATDVGVIEVKNVQGDERNALKALESIQK